MGSLNDRMVKVSNRLKKKRIPTEAMMELGSLVVQEYIKVKPKEKVINKQWETDENGVKYKAISYPKWFHPTIEKFIEDWYNQQVQNKPKRKRIPSKSLIYSTK